MELKNVELAIIIGDTVFGFVQNLEEYDLNSRIAKMSILDDIAIELKRIEEHE